LSDDEEDDPEPVTLWTVNPLTLGIETVGGAMTTIIPRNCKVPTERSKIFSTAIDDQEQFEARIFEGEEPMTRDNHFIGSLRLMGITPAPRGVPEIEVTLAIDTDGMLRVSAEQLGTQVKASMTVTVALSRGQLNAEEMKKEEERIRQAMASKKMLDEYLFEAKSRIAEITEIVSDGLSWVFEQAPKDREVYDEKLKEIQKRVGSLLETMRGPRAAREEPLEHDAL
jgi:molecular chaperone DnaK (HSP70)